MKTTKLFLTAACAICLSTVAFAQTTPAGTGTGTTGTTGTMQNGTMQNGTMTPAQGSDMSRGSMNGKMDRKTKMNGSKGMKKTKTSTTSGTGTM